MSVIWYAWLHIPNGVTLVKIERYDKINKICDVTIRGGITIINIPFNQVEAINGYVLPWEV